MKYIALCISLSLSCFSHANGPDTTYVTMKEHELFINTTYFLNEIFQTNNSSTISPVMIGYHGFSSKHDGLRFAIGGGFTRQRPTNPFPFSNNEPTTGMGSFNVRLGYEYRYQLEKYWTFFTGFDLVANVNWAKGNDNQDNSGINGWNIGAGPVVGIEFNITKKISLFTETHFYYLGGKTDGISSYSGHFGLPTSLFFVYRFIRP